MSTKVANQPQTSQHDAVAGGKGDHQIIPTDEKEVVRGKGKAKDDRSDRSKLDEDGDDDEEEASSTKKRKPDGDDTDKDKFMSITVEERGWAIALKEAAKRDPEIERELSDMEYTQHAMFAKGDTKAALRRIQGMEAFRKKYDIEDTVRDAAKRLRELFDQQPWLVLAVDHDEEQGHFVFAYDHSNFMPCRVRTPECFASLIAGFYYVFHSAHADLLACREGLVTIAECHGMSLANVDIAMERRCSGELGDHYPMEFKEASWLNTPVAATILYNAFSAFVRKDLVDKIRLGCVYPGYPHRITVLYMMPSPEEAEERVLKRIQAHLARRYGNDETFSLS